MTSNVNKKTLFHGCGSDRRVVEKWVVVVQDGDECVKCQYNTSVSQKFWKKVNFYSDRSRKEKWTRREASGLLRENKNEENTAEHLIIYKLTSGPIYTDVLYYTNIDRLWNRWEGGGGLKRAVSARWAKRYYIPR